MQKIIVTIGLFLSTFAAHAACDWNKPGSNPQTGDKIASLRSYAGEIPASILEEIAQKMRTRKFDDQIIITRNAMKGKNDYHNQRDMHWANNRMCKGEVIRSSWKDSDSVGALVYTVSGYSVAVASVCGNVFRLTMAGGAGGGGAVVVTSTERKEEFLIPDAPPAAGNSPAPTPTPENDSSVHGGGGSFFSYHYGEENNSWVNWGGAPLTQNPVVPSVPTPREITLPPVSWGGGGGYVPPVVVIVHPPITIPVVPVAPPVPEPETWGMFLAGLALILARKIRREARAA